MQPDNIKISAEITRITGSEEERQLSKLRESGEKVFGLVDQFQWMPFVVVGKIVEAESATFKLRMVGK